MNCQEARPLLSERLSRPLPATKAGLLAKHLQGCTVCIRFDRLLQTGTHGIRALPTIPPTPRVREAVSQYVARDGQRRGRHTIRRWIGRGAGAMSAAVLVVAVVGLLVLLQSRPRPPQAAPHAVPVTTNTIPADGVLAITARTSDMLRGTFRQVGTSISFNAQRASPTQIVVQVTVNALTFDVTRDLTTDTIYYDGHDRALSLTDKDGLQALGREFARAIGQPHGTLPPHEDLLGRAIALWAEAPVGYPVPAKEIRPSPARPHTVSP